MFGEVLCLPVLPINHTETDRDTESSHKRETENSNNEAEQPSQGAAGRRRGGWEKWIISVFKNVGKLNRGVSGYFICVQNELLAHNIRRDLADGHSPSQDPTESEKQLYEALNPGKKLPTVPNHIQRMKTDCNALKFISPGQ